MLLPEFFRGGHWGQCLELLSHLCQYSDSIILVSGPSGIGKSSLKEALILSESARFSFCEIQATPDLNADGLMAQIDAIFDAPINNELVLLIEDAQHLSLNVMMVLLQLNQRLSGQRHMKIVLFATPDFEQRLSTSAISKDFTEQVHMIELETLTLSEIEGFLIHQWRLAGNHGPLPFNKAMYKKLYSMSSGIPGQLQDLARDLFSGKNVARPKTANGSLSPFMVGSVVSVGLLFCVVAFMWPEADEMQTAQSKPQAPLKMAAVPTPDIQIEPQVIPEVVTQAASQAALVDEYEQKISTLEQKVLELQQQLSQVPEARHANTKPPKAQQPKTQLTNYTKDEKYILGVHSKNYTLQLVGAGNEEKIREFIRANDLTTKARYFKSLYQGKPWFIVIYGNYTSRAAAVSAAEKLPLSVRKLQPWPREYSYVQSTIRKK